MTYGGDVFTYRSTDRPARASRPAPRAPRPEANERPWEAGSTSHADRLQESVARLEQTIAHLSALVEDLTALWEAGRIAPPAAAPPPVGLAPAPSVRPAHQPAAAVQVPPAADPGPVYRAAPDNEVQRPAPVRPVTSAADVKVSLFPGGGTTAMVGQPRIIDP